MTFREPAFNLAVKPATDQADSEIAGRQILCIPAEKKK